MPDGLLLEKSLDLVRALGVRSKQDAQSPYEIEAFLEQKTVWHPIGL